MAVVSIKNKLRRGNLLVGNDAFIPNSYESIASATGTGSASTITFSSIPGTYQHLQIRGIGRLDVLTGGVTGRVRLNSDTGSNYASHLLYGNGTSALATSQTSATTMYLGRVPGDSATSNVVGSFIIDIHDYASTSKYKTIRVFNGVDNNAADTDFWVSMTSGLWMSTSAVDSVTLYSSNSTYNWTTQTSVALYGVKGA
jgi:hypothetical protein